MPNLDMIAQIQLGDTPIIQIMKGDVKVWPTYTPPTYYQVTGLLTNVASSTALPSQVEEGHGFTTTLSITGDYDIITGVSVTMGGNALVGVYNPNTGVINIPEVTGDVVITASAAVVNYSVVAHLTDVSAGTYPDTIRLNRPLTLHLTTDTGYQITSVTVTMGGNSVAGAYNASTGVVSIAHVTGNVVVEATASAQTYTVTADLTHITSSGAATATGGQSYRAVLTPDEHYQITSVTITMGTTTVAGAYNAATGEIEIQWVDGNISITAVAEVYEYPVTLNLTHVTSDFSDACVTPGDPLTIIFSEDSGYHINSGQTKVYMGGVDVTSSVIGQSSTGIVMYIANVTGPIVVTVVAEQVLPYDAQVEYLKSDGTAYIDTGIKGSSDITIEADIKVLSTFTGESCAIFGSRVAGNNAAITLQYYKTSSGTTKYWRWSFGNNAQTTNHNGTTGDYHLSNMNAARTMVITGAHSSTTTCSAATFSNNYNMYVFGMNNGGALGGVGGIAHVPIKSFKIYSGGTLVRDYIPVRKDGVGYLWDKVSETLFGNANESGAFTYGNDVT